MKKKRQHIKGPDPRNPWVVKQQEAEIERELRSSLSELKTGAELHSLFGDDPEHLVRKAGILLFSVARACQLHQISKDDPDIRIIRGMAGALEDLALHLGRLEVHRASIQSGLAAVERLIERVSIFAIGHGMLDCKAVIADRGFGADDIHRMLGASA
jgi:hypothetical protein